MAITFFILSILCILYTLVIILVSSGTFAWFFILAGICSFIMSIIFKNIKLGKIKMPLFIKVLFWIIVVIILIFFVVVESMIVYNSFKQPEKNADYVILLGAKVEGDKPSKTLKFRIEKASEYLKENKNTKVIVSGGKGDKENISEAVAMQKGLMDLGIEEDRIILEDKSVNTAQNLLYSKEIIKDLNSKIVIVTTDFHIMRGRLLAKKQGFTNVSSLSAKSYKPLIVSYYTREFLALIKDKLVGNI